MDNNSLLLTQQKLSIKNIKSKFTKQKLGNLPNNIYPYLYVDKNLLKKSQINQKIYKTEENTRKNSLTNSKNYSQSSKNSTSKFNRSCFNSVNFINSSSPMQFKKKLKKNNFKNNFDIDKIEIKTQEDWELPSTLSKKLSKSISTVKSGQKKDQGKYIKTENNQKLIFNNVGIHYHRIKNNNRIETEKKEQNNNQEINKLKNQIFILLKKNTNLENEKSEKDTKIEILEEKIEKLLNFIKDKNFTGEDNEKIKLKDTINTLENNILFLKNENNELKKEIEKRNKIILALTNNQIGNKINDKKSNKSKSIGKKKPKNDIRKNNNNNNIKTINNFDDIDINKLKKISIDPDNF